MLIKHGTIKNKKKIIMIGCISIIITVILNVIFFNELPKEIALKTDGSNLISKKIFVFIIPAMLVIANFINLKLNNRSSFNAIATNIVFIIVDIALIMFNI